MKKALTATALLFVFGFSVASSARQSVPYKASTPTEVLRTFLTAIEREDLETFKRTLSRDALDTFERNVAISPEPPDAAWKRFFAGARNYDYFRSNQPELLQPRQVTIDENTAKVYFRTPRGETLVVGCVKEGGEWKINIPPHVEGVPKSQE